MEHILFWEITSFPRRLLFLSMSCGLFVCKIVQSKCTVILLVFVCLFVCPFLKVYIHFPSRLRFLGLSCVFGGHTGVSKVYSLYSQKCTVCTVKSIQSVQSKVYSLYGQKCTVCTVYTAKSVQHHFVKV